MQYDPRYIQNIKPEFTGDQKVEIGTDIYQHPQTTMDKNAEFLTKRSLTLRLIKKL